MPAPTISTSKCSVVSDGSGARTATVSGIKVVPIHGADQRRPYPIAILDPDQRGKAALTDASLWHAEPQSARNAPPLGNDQLRPGRALDRSPARHGHRPLRRSW